MIKRENIKLIDNKYIQQYLPKGHPDLIAETQFKKGDYIVCLQKSNGFIKYIKPNYVFKQYVNNSILYVEKDIIDERTSCMDVTFNDKSTWRYASKEEIDEYNKRGKPYDVSELEKPKYEYEVVHCTTLEEWEFVNQKIDNLFRLNNLTWERYKANSCKCLKGGQYSSKSFYERENSKIYSFSEWCIRFGHANPFERSEEEPYDVTTLQKKEKKSLVGRYLKALVDYPHGGLVKKGEYGKIIDNYTADFPSHKGYYCQSAISRVSDSNTIHDGKYELMPEGFNSNNQEEELPEKWGVKVTEENREVLTEWVKKQPNFDKGFLPIKYYVVNSSSDKSYQYWGDILSTIEHTEISYETFLKKVFKQGVEPFPLKEAYLKKLREAHLKDSVKSEKPRKLDPVIYDNNKQEEKQEFLNIKLTKTKSYGNY